MGGRIGNVDVIAVSKGGGQEEKAEREEELASGWWSRGMGGLSGGKVEG